MLLGLLSPAIIALITVFGSKSKELKADFKRKIFRFYKLRPKYIFAAVIVFALIVGCSIKISASKNFSIFLLKPLYKCRFVLAVVPGIFIEIQCAFFFCTR